mgnify:CR=1 FL=1
MTKEEAKVLLPIIKAFSEGKDIQIKPKEGTNWCILNQEDINHWNLKECDFRIKPEPKYRPFKDAEECWQEMQKHQPFGWIKSKEGYFNISYVDDNYVGLVDNDGSISSILLASKNSHQDNTFADGTPFGVKTEEE